MRRAIEVLFFTSAAVAVPAWMVRTIWPDLDGESRVLAVGTVGVVAAAFGWFFNAVLRQERGPPDGR